MDLEVKNMDMKEIEKAIEAFRSLLIKQAQRAENMQNAPAAKD